MVSKQTSTLIEGSGRQEWDLEWIHRLGRGSRGVTGGSRHLACTVLPYAGSGTLTNFFYLIRLHYSSLRVRVLVP